MASNVTRDHHSLTRNLKTNNRRISYDGSDYGIWPLANNAVVFMPTIKTSSGTVDYTTFFIETLNVSSGAGGSDTHYGLFYQQIQTDLTGWDDVYLMYLTGGAGKTLTVNGNGQLGFDLNQAGTACKIDIDDTATLGSGGNTPSIGFDIDIDRAGSITDESSSLNNIGIDLDMTSDTNGTTSNTGISINVSGADTNYALLANGGAVSIIDGPPGAHPAPSSLFEVMGPNTDNATGCTGIFTLGTQLTDVNALDQIGRIDFRCPKEATGTDAILAGASLWGEAEATFAADNNSTALVFGVHTTATAVERMRLTSAGVLKLSYDASNHAAITVADDGHLELATTGTAADLTLDAAGDIALDADGGTFDFKDDTVNLATLTAGSLAFDKAANATLVVDSTAAGTAGKSLTIEASTAATAASNNTNGGDLILKAGGGDGTGTSAMTFFTKVSGTDASAERMRIHTDGNIGIGVADPDAALEIESTTSPQFKVGYNGNESFTIVVGDGGVTTLDAVDGNLYFDSGGSIIMNKGFSFSSADKQLMWGGATQAINVQSGNMVVDSAGALHVDKDTSGDDAEDAVGLWVDFDRAVATSGTNAHNDIGIDLDVNSRSRGISSSKGLDIDVLGHIDGTHTSTGIELNVSGADNSIGLAIDVAGGAKSNGIYMDNKDGGTDFKNVSSEESGDFFMINTIQDGETTLTTVEDGGGSTAHLNMVADGNFTVDAEGDISLDAQGGNITLLDGGGTYTPSATSDATTKAYVDSVSPQISEVALSEANMNDLHNTEITLVAAQGAGLVVLPISIYLFIDRDASTAQSVNSNLFVSWDGTTSYQTTAIGYYRRFMYNEAGDRIFKIDTYNGEIGQSLTAGDNQPLTVKLDLAITSGSIDGMKVITTYYIYDNS